MALGTVLKIGGELAAGEAAEEAAQRKAAIGEQNALLAEERAVHDEANLRYQFRKLVGQNRASVGASGVTMEGSPMEVLRESVANMEHDAINIRRRGMQEARSYRMGAESDLKAGADAKTVSYFGAASSLLSGATSIAMTQKGSSQRTKDDA